MSNKLKAIQTSVLLFGLGISLAVAIAPGASAAQPNCPGNACHRTSTGQQPVDTTTITTTTIAAATTTATATTTTATTTTATTSTATTTTTAPTTTSSSLLSYASATSYSAPAFAATRTIDVYTQSAFMTAWANIQPGDQINVHGVTFTGTVNLTNTNLSNWAQVNFDSNTHFTGPTSATDNPDVYIENTSHVRIYGGDLNQTASNAQAGVGILIHGGVNNVSWWGFVVHYVGDTAVAVYPAEALSSNLDLKGEVYDWGHNLAWDDHAEKGTGEHGVNLSDANYSLTNSRVAVYAHDGATGSGMEIGSDTSSSTGNTIYLWCQNLTKIAKVQVAGNCLQVWGQSTLNTDVKYLEAENLTGRPYDANGVYSGQSLLSDTVDYGRSSNTNTNPYLSSTESAIPANMLWDTRHNTVFQNVSPLP